MDKNIYLCTEPIKVKESVEFDENLISSYAYIGNYIVDDDENYNIIKVLRNVKKRELYKDVLLLSKAWSNMPDLYFSINALIYKSNDFYTKKNQYLFLPKHNEKIGLKHKTNFKNSFNFLKKYDIDANTFSIYLSNFYFDLFKEKLIYDTIDDLSIKLHKMDDKTLVSKVNKLKCFFMKDVYNNYYNSSYDCFVDFLSNVVFNISDNKYSYIDVESMYNINTMRRLWYSNDYLLINLNNSEVISYVKQNCLIANKIF